MLLMEQMKENSGRYLLFMKGLFITLEGIDASGKTSIAVKIQELLRTRGVSVAQLEKKQTEYSSPYLTNFMTNFKGLLWDSKNTDPVTEIPDEGWLFMHALWYRIIAEHLINPLLESNQIVLIDSWYYKILARFLLKEKFDDSLTYKVFDSLPRGDYVFMLDAHPEVCWKRRNNFKQSELGGHDFYEGTPYLRFTEYQSKVREQLLKLSQKNKGWFVIDTQDMDVEKVANLVVEQLNECLNSRSK
jgi:dTMP kinase